MGAGPSPASSISTFLASAAGASSAIVRRAISRRSQGRACSLSWSGSSRASVSSCSTRRAARSLPATTLSSAWQARRVVARAARDLGLGLDRRERGAQLVRRVGGEAALALDQAADAAEQRVQAAHQRHDLGRRVPGRERAQVAGRARLDLAPERAQRPERAADDEPGEQAERRQRERERHQQVARDAGGDLLARLVALADLDQEAPLVVPGAEHAPALAARSSPG